MRTTPEILQKQWDSISYKEGGFLQVHTQHSLEWHIGYQSISQKTLLLICNTDVEVIDSSKSMLVTRRKRETDNRYTFSFELLRNEQEDVFVILCSDIIEHSRLAKNEKVALDWVISRFKQWGRLLQSQKKGVMDERRRKGLFGELLFLWEWIKKSSSVLDTIKGWVGAEGLDQDFVYENSWYEVKSIGLSATSVTISSLEQLDSSSEGELVVMRVDKAAPDKVGALSLNDVVHEISLTLANSSNALDLFQSKLSAYGYIDLQEYSKQKYYYSGSQRYEVDKTFPRIMRSNIPLQVESLHYELSLPAMSDWLKG